MLYEMPGIRPRALDRIVSAGGRLERRAFRLLHADCGRGVREPPLRQRCGRQRPIGARGRVRRPFAAGRQCPARSSASAGGSTVIMLGLTSTTIATDLRVFDFSDRMVDGASSIHRAASNATTRSTPKSRALRVPITSRSRRSDQTTSHTRRTADQYDDGHVKWAVEGESLDAGRGGG